MHSTSNFPSNWHTCLPRLTWPQRKFWTNLKSKVTDDEMSGHELQHSPRIRKSNFRISLASPHLPTVDRGGVQVQRLSNETWITIFTSDFPPQPCLNIGVIFPYKTKSKSLLGQQGGCLACADLLFNLGSNFQFNSANCQMSWKLSSISRQHLNSHLPHTKEYLMIHEKLWYRACADFMFRYMSQCLFFKTHFIVIFLSCFYFTKKITHPCCQKTKHNTIINVINFGY